MHCTILQVDGICFEPEPDAIQRKVMLYFFTIAA